MLFHQYLFLSQSNLCILKSVLLLEQTLVVSALDEAGSEFACLSKLALEAFSLFGFLAFCPLVTHLCIAHLLNCIIETFATHLLSPHLLARPPCVYPPALITSSTAHSSTIPGFYTPQRLVDALFGCFHCFSLQRSSIAGTFTSASHT